MIADRLSEKELEDLTFLMEVFGHLAPNYVHNMRNVRGKHVLRGDRVKVGVTPGDTLVEVDQPGSFVRNPAEGFGTIQGAVRASLPRRTIVNGTVGYAAVDAGRPMERMGRRAQHMQSQLVNLSRGREDPPRAGKMNEGGKPTADRLGVEMLIAHADDVARASQDPTVDVDEALRRAAVSLRIALTGR